MKIKNYKKITNLFQFKKKKKYIYIYIYIFLGNIII